MYGNNNPKWYIKNTKTIAIHDHFLDTLKEPTPICPKKKNNLAYNDIINSYK
jgi:hypothetical protein